MIVLIFCQDVSTRWNSTYDMIERVLEQQLAVSAVLLQRRNLVHLEISPNEWRILEDIVQLLRPFKIATLHLSGEKYPTISALGPLLGEIKKKVAADVSDSVVIREFKRALRDDINSRYQHPDIQMLLNKASYLDPRFKSLTHLSSFQQSEVSDAILQELIELENDSDDGSESDAEREPNNESNDESNDECSTAEPRKKKAKNALLDMLGDSFIVQAAATCTSTHEDMIHAEVLRYKSETTIPLDQYPLEWWCAHSCVFPNISKLARKYLCIVATSVPSEQVFSTAGNIVSVKRASLLPENVNKLVFLHDNLPKVKFDYKRIH